MSPQSEKGWWIYNFFLSNLIDGDNIEKASDRFIRVLMETEEMQNHQAMKVNKDTHKEAQNKGNLKLT